MKVLDGQTLNRETFVLEEVCFVNCVLHDCHLFYSGGDYEWANTTFQNCHFHFRGAAKNSQALMGHLGLLKPPETPPVVPATTGKLN